jgi:hypothetical protein
VNWIFIYVHFRVFLILDINVSELCVSFFVVQEPLEYVRAVADYVTRESTLLSFRKGDVIRVVRDEQYVDKGKNKKKFFLFRQRQK